MNFGLTETQTTLKNTVRKFLAAECPMAEVRKQMETETAFDAALWVKIAEQGWTGIVFPEEYGGFGMGMVEMAVTLEEMGRALLPGPFSSTVLLAGSLIEAAGSESQKQKYLGAICRGEAKATLALLEDFRILVPRRDSHEGIGPDVERRKTIRARRRSCGFSNHCRSHGRGLGPVRGPRKRSGYEHHTPARNGRHSQTLPGRIR